MNDEHKQDGAEPTPASDGSAGFERLRICPVPDDDFGIGVIIFGMLVVPAIIGLLLLVVVCAENFVRYGKLTPPSAGTQADEPGQAWNGAM